ncbi:MAG: hypothetical protein KDA66_12295 [Planctomycetaceae bacterium]|nr:hypothetical protein [Planctomycetaceae bacterium]
MSLKQAESYLLALLGTGDSMLDYSIVWTLGQCGSDKCAGELASIEADAESPSAVRRIAGYAHRQVVSDNEREELISRCLQQLPEELQSLAKQGPSEQFESALRDALNGASYESSSVLEMAYYIDNEHVRPALINILRELPLKPNLFHRIRHIFKAAEMRRDTDVFGMLAWRFETTMSNFRTGPSWYYRHQKMPATGQDATQAFSSQTRDFLRKRVWRTLKKLGEGASRDYCKMASGVLKQFTDTDASEPFESRIYRWDPQQRRSNFTTVHYDRYASFHAFNRILYGNSLRYELDLAGKRFRCSGEYRPGQAAPARREEAFPELWNNSLDEVIALLLVSQCGPVHSFGIGALQANSVFHEAISNHSLAGLLAVKYGITIRFAFDLVVKRFDADQPDVDLLLALANCELEEARIQGQSWIRQCREGLTGHHDFWADLIVSREASSRRFVRDELPNLLWESEDAQIVIGRVLARFSSMTNAECDIVRDAAETLLIAFPSQLSHIGIDVIRDLTQHPLMQVQRFAGELILRHSEFSAHPPIEIVDAFLKSEHEELRNVGVRIISQLPESVLAESVDFLFELVRHEQEDIRKLIRPAITKIAASDAKFGRQIALKLIEALLIPGAPEGVPSHTAHVLRKDLREHLSDVSQEMVWKLLYSRSGPAQDVGGMLLSTNVESSNLSVEEVVGLCHHRVLSVRESAREMCLHNLQRLKDDPENAILIVDSAWEDTRQFAFEFVEKHFTNSGALSPETLISICDSVRPDVQQFGRKMITRLFETEHGEGYLLRLSEHPSQGMQMFVSNLLDQYARDPHVLRELSLFFITVLSRVNRGRVAKTRTLNLLQQEAMKSEESARIVAEILSRLSATTAVMDRGKMIEIMVQIQQSFPNVELPLVAQPLEVRGGV